MGTAWDITAVVVPALLAIGVGVITVPPLENRILAIACFLVSGIWLGVVGFMWLIHTPAATVWRVVAGLGIGVAVFVVVPQLMRMAWPPEKLGDQTVTSDTPSSLPTSGRESVTITGGDNVVSVGQIGGITAKTVTVNPPVRPEFRIISKNETENPDGTHTITMTGEVVSPVTPGLMIVSIKAQGMRAANIISEPTGVGSSTLKRNIVRAPDSYSAEILSPRGRYIVVVDVDKLTNIDFNVAF